MTKDELNYLEDIRADFDTFLSEENWDAARACINEMGDRGQEMEALKMHQEYNKKLLGENDWKVDAEVDERRLRADETYD